MELPEKSFVFCPQFNSASHAGHDATGAFQPGAGLYRRHYEGLGKQVVSYRFDNTAPDANRRRAILDAFQRGAGSQRYDAFVYFGHGSSHAMRSAGFNLAAIDDLARALRIYAKPSAKIVLYACSCAASGGFAYQLARALSGWAHTGLTVIGHTTIAHSYRNPQVRRFPSSRGEAGEAVAPDGKYAAWAAALHDRDSLFWAEFPFMTPVEINAAL